MEVLFGLWPGAYGAIESLAICACSVSGLFRWLHPSSTCFRQHFWVCSLSPHDVLSLIIGALGKRRVFFLILSLEGDFFTSSELSLSAG